MNTKSKVFYASSSLIPTVAEALNVQFEQDYKVKMEKRIDGSAELTILKYEFLAWSGGKILKTITLSPASNGQIRCQVSGLGWGGILVPVIVSCILDSITLVFPLLFFVSAFITWAVIYGIIKKNKLTNEIFQLTQDAIEASKNMPIDQTVEKQCPNCGTIVQSAGFCQECGTKVN